MKLIHAVLGRLDPWAALVLGGLVALGVVILLATPGPWHKVVGSAASNEFHSAPPANVAVFASGVPDGACTTVAWLHVDNVVPSVTLVVIAPDTQAFVPGAGLTPIRRVVDEAGPAAASAALGRALGVPMDAWVSLDQVALRLATGPMLPTGDGRVAITRLLTAKRTWESGVTATSWIRQYYALVQGLPRIPLRSMSVVAFANYILGFGHVRSDLNLRTATSIATSLNKLDPSLAQVRAADAVVETCRRGEAWRFGDAQLAQLRQWLAFDIAPPDAGPTVRREPRPARVLVVFPGTRKRAAVYAAEVRRSLRRSAGAPVAVDLLAEPVWSRLAGRAETAIAARRPLAVLVGPPGARLTAAGAQAAASALRDLGAVLRERQEPAVMSGQIPLLGAVSPAAAPVASSAAAGGSSGSPSATPMPAATAAPASAAIAAALRATALPVSPLGGLALRASPSARSTLRAAAAANAETFVRACWPGTLAPRLASTRLGLWYLARQRTTVGLVASSPAASSTAAMLAQLRVWGFGATRTAPGAWRPARAFTSVYYRRSSADAALALAGDLGLGPAAVVADDAAPAAVTLFLHD